MISLWNLGKEENRKSFPRPFKNLRQEKKFSPRRGNGKLTPRFSIMWCNIIFLHTFLYSNLQMHKLSCWTILEDWQWSLKSLTIYSSAQMHSVGLPEGIDIYYFEERGMLMQGRSTSVWHLIFKKATESCSLEGLQTKRLKV